MKNKWLSVQTTVDSNLHSGFCYSTHAKVAAKPWVTLIRELQSICDISEIRELIYEQ